MTWPVILRDVRRCLRAAALPAVAVFTTNAIRGVAAAAEGSESRWHDAPGLVSAVLIAAVAWLAFAVSRAATQPVRDRRSAQQLASLRERAGSAGRSLWEVQRTEWSCEAGERAICVDVLTGRVAPMWFSEAHFLPGTFVVVVADDDGHRPEASLSTAAVTAAHRGQSRADLVRQSRARSWAADEARRTKMAAKRLLREAERLLHSSG